MMKENDAPKTVYLTDYQPPPFLLETVDLRFELGESTTRVVSELALHRNPDAAPTDTLVLDGGDFALKTLMLNDEPVAEERLATEEERVAVRGVPERFVLKVETELHPQENTTLEGLYQSSGIFCTQCEAEGFRKITYYLDRPDVMAKFRTTIVADKQKYPVLLSNGNLVDSGELDHGRHWVRWEDPFPKPSYLFALVAGELAHIKDHYITASGREVQLQIYVEPHNIDQCEHAMRSLKKAMRWDELVFGLEYDLDIYMIVAVDDFNMGAMENKGLNIFNSKYVLAKPATATDADFQAIEGVIGHEYFHNWTGNRVTLRDWFQLSLKEGLTVFRDQEFSADMTSRAVKRINDVRLLRARQFLEDAGPMAHPVRPAYYMEINNFYTATVYEKGAEVIRMIHTLLGPEGFRKGLDLYFRRHDGQAVTCDDFVDAMQDATGRDLRQFKLWYSQAGTPVLRISEAYDERQRTYSLTVRQSCPPTPGQEEKQPFHIPLAVSLLNPQGGDLELHLAGEKGAVSTQRILEVTETEQTFFFENIPVKPVASLLRGFSAPVKLDFQTTTDALAFRMVQDTDAVNRWDAAQSFALYVMHQLVTDYQTKRVFVLDQQFADACRATLVNGELDPALIAEALTLPSEQLVGEMMEVVDVEGIHAAREFLRRALGEALEQEFRTVYLAHRDEGEYHIDAKSVARRTLKNLCLTYLTASEKGEWLDLAMRQFKTATNMTDVMAALRAWVNVRSERREKVLSDFYEQWKDEPLVLDKWLALQASSHLPGTLQRVKELMAHSAFDIKNPNRVRALIGTFCTQNHVCFHQAGGEGYRFLADRVVEIDRLNPQVAARLASAFSRWRKYDTERQLLMQGQLERVLKVDGLSRDVFEVVSKSLAKPAE